MKDTRQIGQLHEFIEAVLGAGCTFQDRSRSFGRQSITWRVATSNGHAFFLKKHELRQHFEAERHALSEWVPLIENDGRWASPELVAADEAVGAMIITALDGEPLDEIAPSRSMQLHVHNVAGWLVARIHEIDTGISPPTRVQPYGPELAERLLEGAEGLVEPETLRWVRSTLLAPAAFDSLPPVPTHSDYSPRNWIRRRR